MTEQVNLIPARLKSAVIGGHVAGADQIIDDNLGKTQNTINAETNSKFEQIDNEIEGFEKQDVVPVDTLPDVATADPKKVYRVVDETTYTDYMVNATGDGWKKIYEAEFPGIDNVPTAGSDNLVKSSGIDKSLKKVSDTVLEFVGEGSTQVNIFNISLYKGHKYSLSGLDYNYTASTGAKVIIYGHNDGESDVIIASAAYNRTQQLIFEVNADYDTIYAKCRANVGDKVSLLLNDVTDVYPQMAYAVPISGAFNLTLNYTTSPKTHKLAIPSSFDLVSDTYSKRYSYSGGDVIFQNNGDREQLLVFNLKSLTFRSENGNRSDFPLDENDRILGTIDVSTGNCYFNFQYTENNLPVVRNGYDSVPTTDSSKLLTSGAIKEALDSIGSPSHNLLPYGNYNKGLSLFPFVLDYLEGKYWSDEMSTFNSLVSAVNSRQGMYKIAFVTDTHEGGFYALNGTSSLRCVALFNKLADFVDIFAHGGDISCDYGTSVDRYLAYMLEAINFFNIPAAKNFLITKGNHDARDVEYDEVNPLDVNWSNGTYFENPSHGDESKFTEVTQQTYRGGGLYVADAGRLSDSKFRFVQAKNAPIDAVWGSGAYYYYDIASTKIRFVVANSYSYKDDGTSGSTDESKWLMQTALDLHDKATPSDWLVVIIRHKEGTTSNDLKNILQAFQSGSSVTIAGVTVNYGTLNGGGCNLIYLHGHEHGSAGYSNMNGYLDLGFKNACVSMLDFGDAEKYNIYVLSVDTDNKKLISDCINGNSYTYDYVNSIVELSIGDSILMARSGLSSQSEATWVSSDDSVAIVGEHTGIVTGVSAGTATITGTKGSIVRTYTVKVVS